MKHIFLLRFSGGSCGDFLTSQISEDPNFYFVGRTAGPNNTWDLDNPMIKYNLFLKEIEFPAIPDEARNDLDKVYSEKHLILGTHSWHHNIMDVNLPRLRVVRLVSSGHMTFLFYFLLWIKRHAVLQTNFEYIEPFRDIDPYPEKTKKFQSIYANGFFRGVERACFRLKVYPHIDSVERFFHSYYEESEAIKPRFWKREHVRLDVGEFFKNPEKESIIWEKAFDMHGHINIPRIQEYHNEDLALFESTLGRPPSAYKNREDFLRDLKNYISKICPDLCE